MVLLSIGFTPQKYDVYDKLREVSSYFKDRNIDIEAVENDCGELHFVRFSINDEDMCNYCIPELKEAFNIYISNILYEIIVEDFVIDTLKRIIKKNYYFQLDEMDNIISKCLDVLRGNNEVSSDFNNLYMKCRNKIMNKVLEYVKENDNIVLEGFLRFRLRELNEDLEEIVDRVVEEYLVEREYDEFIKLLRYFVEVQESQLETVNIVIEDDGNYCMYDSNLNEIRDEVISDFEEEVLRGDVNRDDLLVSSLITLAPRYIIIHNVSNVRNKEIIDTIKNVFTDRIKICSGCDICKRRKHVTRYKPQ